MGSNTWTEEPRSTSFKTANCRSSVSSRKLQSSDSKSSKLRPLKEKFLEFLRRKVVMPARLRLSWGMKTLKLFLLSVLESLEFGCQAIRYALIFVSVFFRQRASLGCEMVAMRSQLTFYKESIRRKRQPRPRFNPAFRLFVGVAVKGVERMEVRGQPDETQDCAPVA